ncbi:fungal-specific transcription factor domain-containing protein [Emericellopsis atlantica]|uniref:Fungal-specific transcription factor domain-containing protein n=1 Tax=Emericellopsis atlantica TaxID=2614577 RepID=A0A9P7ZQM5_9HYPO|nr:fungal-specific transcription factor domain-containing protein [Emericellopsis atlantica]KAG9256007.1 fungal-specific transcription factor domain-containing protein [Emericellopsis atlantica]
MNDNMDTESDPVLICLEQLQSSPTATAAVHHVKSAQQPTKSRTKRARVACLHCRRRKVPRQPVSSPRESASISEDMDLAVHHGELGTLGDNAKDHPSSTGKQHEVLTASIEDENMACQLESIDIPSLQVPTVDLGAPGLWSAPYFVHCDLSGLSSEDLAYLQNKGCFHFPDKHILDQLLLSYFDYIHPHMPFIDETEFWDMYRTHFHSPGTPLDAGQHCFSILLFQAMLFAATTCAPVAVLTRLGYTSRGKARREAFSRARALYSLDIEKDNLVLVQTFLLMSYWKGQVGEDKDGWHWVGLAVSLALHLGLHRQPRPRSTLTQRQQTIRRRCWWGCVVRDRLLALSQQRQPRIQLQTSDVGILTLADYNVGLRSGVSNLSSAEELGKRTATSIFSVQLIRLMLSVEREDDLSNGRAYPSSPAASPPETWSRKQTASFDDGRMVGHAGLDNWRLHLPEVLQPSTCPDADESVLPCILVHRNVLQIYYHKLILSMITPLRWPKRVSTGQASMDMQLAHTSTLALLQLHNALVDHDAVHCLPGSCFDAASLTKFDATLQTPPAEDVPLPTRPRSPEGTHIQSPISPTPWSQSDMSQSHCTDIMNSCDYLDTLDSDQSLLDLTISGASGLDEPLFPDMERIDELDSVRYPLRDSSE